MISDEVLNKFKQRMRINYDTDDDNLRSMLERSFIVVSQLCGAFDLNSDEPLDVYGTFLTLEHARYTFNDDVEFFIENFQSDLQNLAYGLKGREVNEEQNGV